MPGPEDELHVANKDNIACLTIDSNTRDTARAPGHGLKGFTATAGMQGCCHPHTCTVSRSYCSSPSACRCCSSRRSFSSRSRDICSAAPELAPAPGSADCLRGSHQALQRHPPAEHADESSHQLPDPPADGAQERAFCNNSVCTRELSSATLSTCKGHWSAAAVRHV